MISIFFKWYYINFYLQLQKLCFHWGEEATRKRTGLLSSYAEAKKIEALTLRTSGCYVRVIIRDFSSVRKLYLKAVMKYYDWDYENGSGN